MCVPPVDGALWGNRVVRATLISDLSRWFCGDGSASECLCSGLRKLLVSRMRVWLFGGS